MADCLSTSPAAQELLTPPDHFVTDTFVDKCNPVIEECNLQEQCDEVLSIRSIYEGSDEERITIISQPEDGGCGLFRILIKVPITTPSERVQVDLMMPVVGCGSPAHTKQESSPRSNAVQRGALETEETKSPSGGAEESEVKGVKRAAAGRLENDEVKAAGGALVTEKLAQDLRGEVEASAVRGPTTAAAATPQDIEAAAADEATAFEDATAPNLGNGVTLQRTLSGQRWLGSVAVSYLSPLTLQVTLPPSYPSADPPAFVLSCAWLRSIQLSALCKKLDQLWESMANMPIIYSWIDFLENEALGFLGLSTNVVLISSGEGDLDEGVDDRALSECQDIGQAIHSLLQYSHNKEAVMFCKSIQECSLCFDKKIGSKFYRLEPCKHHFCYDCLSAHCNINVQDGNIQFLTCPGFECKSAIHPGILQNLLPPDAFLRWETLCLQRTLDEMDDVVYCPRCQSAVIREQEAALNLGHCLTCYYSFCTECDQPWHQGSDCMTELDRLNLQETRIQARDTTARERFIELRRQAESEAVTIIYMKKSAVKCPHCKVLVEKDGGCNKMTCRCGKQFCWVCKNGITGYEHFQANGCNLMSVQAQPDRIIRRPQAPDALLWMQAQAELENPGNPTRDVQCIQCKQKNYKLHNNNHIKCWNCKTNMCFVCRNRIIGVITKHFNVSGCPQHS